MISGDFEPQVCRAYVAGYKDYKETDFALGNAKLNNIHLIHQG